MYFYCLTINLAMLKLEIMITSQACVSWVPFHRCIELNQTFFLCVHLATAEQCFFFMSDQNDRVLRKANELLRNPL